MLKIKNPTAITNPRPISTPTTTNSATGKPNIDVWWLLGAPPEPKKKNVDCLQVVQELKFKLQLPVSMSLYLAIENSMGIHSL